MRKIICLVIILNILLGFMPEKSLASSGSTEREIELEYLTPLDNDRDINTFSIHILNKIPAKNSSISFYNGLTITRPQGEIFSGGEKCDSSALSDGLILYNKKFPVEGRIYNFMWRAGPQFSYKFDQNTAVSIGYKLMHVSNGSSIFGKGHNPSYNASGFSLSIVTHF
ncbi:MAG: Lipid 3-O-deacylase-related protein [Firmicutes bacterium]|nr:Lipid 3-O-deacylase-related protein [Bacillota bacterium]